MKCTLPDPSKMGNMYYRGEWEYCPEYKTGDVVSYYGVMYLAVKPHAGKEPGTDMGRGYWQQFGVPTEMGGEDEDYDVMDAGFSFEGKGHRQADGGFSDTISLDEDSYENEDLSTKIDGGSSSCQRRRRLV